MKNGEDGRSCVARSAGMRGGNLLEAVMMSVVGHRWGGRYGA